MTPDPDPETLARDWIGYAILWSARQRPRSWDWEQAAIDGLFAAIRRHRGGAFGGTLEWALKAEAKELRRYHGAACRAGAASLGGVEPPGRECDPWLAAAINEGRT